MNKRSYLFKCIAVTLTFFAMLFFLGACEEELTPPEESEYIEENEFESVLMNAEPYRGKWIKIAGKVFEVKKKSDKELRITAYYSPYEENLMFYADIKNEMVDSVNPDDYILINGYIRELNDGEHNGKEVIRPTITAVSATVGSYDEVTAPTETKEVGETLEQNGIKITLDRIGYMDDTDRVYITIKNDSANPTIIDTVLSEAIQDGETIEHEKLFTEDFDDIGHVGSGKEKSGFLRFKGLEPGKPLTIKIYADCVESGGGMLEFSFDVE